MIKANPLITVYITNFNYGKFVKKAINSVLNQTFKNYELIIIDDGSKDKSIEIIKEFQNKKNIQIGKRNFGKVSVLSGLNEGEVVIAEGVSKVRDKAKVKIITPK